MRAARGGVLVAGGGFAGAYVARLLGRQGATIVSPTRRTSPTIHDAILTRRRRFDACSGSTGPAVAVASDTGLTGVAYLDAVVWISIE